MALTKAQCNDLVKRGLAQESFQHETLGHFNITELREIIGFRVITSSIELHRCSFNDINTVDGIETDAIEYLCGSREIDYIHAATLTEAELKSPLLFLQCPAGTNGQDESQLLVDGIHRLYERKRRGYGYFEFYLWPLEQAPLVNEKQSVSIPWGEKEVVPGVGLIRRDK